jgi:hypothetical protein
MQRCKLKFIFCLVFYHSHIFEKILGPETRDQIGSFDIKKSKLNNLMIHSFQRIICRYMDLYLLYIY